MRTFLMLSAAVLAAANSQQCVNTIVQSVADVAIAAEDIHVISQVCKGGDESACLAKVRGFSAQITTLAGQVGSTLVACDGAGAACTADVNAAGAGLNQVLDTATQAATDCSKSGSKMDCTVDILDAASHLGHTVQNVVLATSACASPALHAKYNSSISFTPACQGDLVAVITSIIGSITNVKDAIAACEEGVKCAGASEAAAVTIALGVESAAKALATCGIVTESACAIDIQTTIQWATKAANKVKAAVQHCEANPKGVECSNTVIDITADLSHAMVYAIQSGKDCGAK